MEVAERQAFSESVYGMQNKYLAQPLLVNPIIDVSDCTLDTASDAKIMIYIEPPKP